MSGELPFSDLIVGDRVMISKDSPYYSSTQEWNPIMAGRITRFRPDARTLKVVCVWKNGREGFYNLEDLILAPEPVFQGLRDV